MGSLPQIVEDCLGIVQVFSDGSISRSDDINFPMKVEDDGSAVWKDCLYDKKNHLHLRLYKPAAASPSPAKLPILYFFHGGGFCIGSRTWPNCHNCCLRLASALRVMVVAPDYRLAPEHKLPAAVEDALTAVKWLQIQALLGGCGDEWLRDGVDFDRVFVAGDSSGGNLAHHLAVNLGSGSPSLDPVRVRGYVLMAPFFGGTVRTKSESEGPPEDFINVDILDRFWRLALPNGETADHPLANPLGAWSWSVESRKVDPILVVVGGKEVMKERIENYYKRLKEMGKEIEYVEFQGQQHGFFINAPFSQVADEFLHTIRRFIHTNY